MDDQLATFVDAADRLINLLATEPPTRASARRRHQADLDAAYDAYDQARRDITGEPDPFEDE